MTIDTLTIKGFKSIQSLENFKLNNLNVLIGPNGTGKSNFISYFNMLSELVNSRLQLWVSKQGGADRVVTFGVKKTSCIDSSIVFGAVEYKFELESTIDNNFIFTNESLNFSNKAFSDDLGSGHTETELSSCYHYDQPSDQNCDTDYHYSLISGCKVFHFHDTTNTAGVRRFGVLHDHLYFRQDASNLAAFLFRIKQEHNKAYQKIRKMVELAIPFFDDFVLIPSTLPSEESIVNLQWRQKNSDYPLWPTQLSDGSIRFICLVTALLQPNPPPTIIIDEPELGLHPSTITLLGGLLRSASTQIQLIISTQSTQLINEFSIDDLIIVEREKEVSIFKRPDGTAFQAWLENYSVGKLWEKNILGGRLE